MRVLVAEDEAYNRRRLSRLLREAGCEVVAELDDGASVLEWLEAGGEADALFLDIQMPGPNGLEVLADLPRPLPVVFVTAYSDHAVRAFEIEARDYLLKPVTAERLAKSLDRIRTGLPPQIAKAAEQVALKATRYPVKAGEGVLMLELSRTTHFEVVDGVIWAHAGERFRTLWKSLGEVEEAFPKAGLLRAHRHLLLRPEVVVGLKAGTFGRLLVRIQGGVELEVSRGSAPKLKERLGLS